MFLLNPEKLPAELVALVKHRNLAEGERLYRRGDRALAVFAVEKGRLHLLSQSSDGRPVTIYVARAGECVSEAALFSDRYCSDAVAETASRVAVFPKMSLLEVLQKHPDLSEEFMAMLAKRFNEVRVRLELRNLQSARERVVQYLSLAVTPGNNELVLDRPLKYIAEDLGLAPESFYRTLAQLVRDGFIIRKGRQSSSCSYPMVTYNPAQMEAILISASSCPMTASSNPVKASQRSCSLRGRATVRT